MFLVEKSPRSYVGLYQKFLYKILIVTNTSLPNILLWPSPMWQRLRLGQGAQFSVLLNKLRPSAVAGAHFPNALPTQWFYNLRVTHESQVTHRELSYESFFFSSATVPGETFHCAKRSVVVWEEGPDEGLIDKEPAPPLPEIHNSAAPPFATGEPI